MLTRRNLLASLASLPAMPTMAWAMQNPAKVVLYTTLDKEIIHYDVDVANATLTRRGSVSLPATVQYGWPHASRRFLYVVCSDVFKDANTTQHYLAALRIDPQSGELSVHGQPQRLANRPIHMTTDIPSRHVLVAFPTPAAVKVFRVNEDFTVGSEVPQPNVTDTGFYAHQVRVTPDNRQAILVTRGNDATATKPEDPGALKIFDYRNGSLSNEYSFAPDGNGLGFGPRNLDFHPTRPWAYISLERQNKLLMFELDKVRATPRTYLKDTLGEPHNVRPLQLAGIIHVHPNGRFVYVTNRATSTSDDNGDKVFAGGENHVSVFSIDQKTGEPTLIQRADQRKIYPRTVDVDPSGRLAAVQCTVPMKVRDGNEVRMVPAGITVSRIGDDGRLSLVRSYDSMDYSRDNALWMAFVRL
jgi:6-phosphogluconolactonase (cycloisomerase 2 family)